MVLHITLLYPEYIIISLTCECLDMVLLVYSSELVKVDPFVVVHLMNNVNHTRQALWKNI